MNRIYRKITLLSLLFYLVSTAYVRFDEFNKVCDLFMRSIYSLPLDVFPLSLFEGGKKFISIQMGILSPPEIVNLLETNPDTLPELHNGMVLDQPAIRKSQGEYLVIRFKYYGSCYFDLKYYLPCFSYAINLDDLHLCCNDTYRIIILPYPKFLEKDCKTPGDISMRWKFFW